jgi:preprotein translocase subunit SecG
MRNFLPFAQIIIAIFLILSILLQQRGGELGSLFGGGIPYTSKRGIEKKIFWASIVFAILFIILALLNLI